MNIGFPLPQSTASITLHNTPLSSTNIDILRVSFYFGVSWVDLARGNRWREIPKILRF